MGRDILCLKNQTHQKLVTLGTCKCLGTYARTVPVSNLILELAGLRAFQLL